MQDNADTDPSFAYLSSFAHFTCHHYVPLQSSAKKIAIKVVSRQKLTTKLLENLESEINILKSIHHRNIVALLDCFVSTFHHQSIGQI